MLAEKGFLDVFKRYQPSREKEALLRRAVGAKFKYIKEPAMIVEVDLTFESHEDAEQIYEIEDECRELYGAASFKILPHFPPSEFNISRLDEIAAEASICGAVTQGFFQHASYEDDGETVHVTIPYTLYGVNFVKGANTETILSNILLSRYGVRRAFSIASGPDAEQYAEEWESRRAQMLIDAERESREAFLRGREEAARAREEEARRNDPHYDFDHRAGLSSLTGDNEMISETVYRMGPTVYDFTEPEAVWGEDFSIGEPAPLSAINSVRANAAFLGTVFETEGKETRDGEKLTLSVYRDGKVIEVVIEMSIHK